MPFTRLPGTLLAAGLCAVAPAAVAQQHAGDSTAARPPAAGTPAPPPAGDSAGEPEAPSLDTRGIVLRAIARRRAMLAAAGGYRYQVFSELVVRDPGEPSGSARSVPFFVETRSAVYARYRAGYQETVEAHRRTGDGSAGRDVVAVGDIADFDRDRIALSRYVDLAARGRPFRRAFGDRGGVAPADVTVPSPLASDALAHYEYRVLDTVAVGGIRAFRLAVVPRSGSAPLFVGTMEITDSSGDLVALDLGVTDAVRFPPVTNLRYQERLDDVGGGRWMPVEIRLSGEARPRITGPRLPEEAAGITVPRLPGRVDFEEVARADSFRFGVAGAPPGFGEYRVIVAGADGDSASWTEPPAVPLSDAQEAALVRADSLARRPPSAAVRAGRGIGFVAGLAADPDFFHYNRVDGLYLGAGHDWRLAPPVALHVRLGWAFGERTPQYDVGPRVLLSPALRLWVGGSYHDETSSRPTLISSGYNPTFRALFARLDPLDYYRERGYDLELSTRLPGRTQLDVVFDDGRESSLGLSVTSISGRRPIRPNPPIADGRMRSLGGTLTWDSRQLLRAQDTDVPLASQGWTRITVGGEVAAHDVLASDFSYRRWSVQVERHQRTLWGVTTVTAAGGLATGYVPPQRYFVVDFGMEFLTFQGNGFNTLSETNFAGNRAALIVVTHEFDRTLGHLPFRLSVHGGAFMTAFVAHAPFPGDSLQATAPHPYTEAGFGIGNLTPFLSPLDVAIHFTWQLSSYPTRRFRFGFSLGEL